MASLPKSLPSGPGLIFIQVEDKLGALSKGVVSNWMNDFGLPGTSKTSGNARSTTWRCADSSSTSPYLSLSVVEDLAKAAEEAGLPAGSHDIASMSGSDGGAVGGPRLGLRYYSFVEVFQKGNYDESRMTHTKCIRLYAIANEITGYPVSHIITAGMEPSTEEASVDLDKWYVEEHNEQMSLEPGWVRSRRYKLADGPGSPEQGHKITWMTIHEFGEGNKLGDKVEPLDPLTPWTKKVMSEMSVIEASVWINTRIT